MDHSREFLNIGNKDKEVTHKIFEPNDGKDVKGGTDGKKPNPTNKIAKNTQTLELRKKYIRNFSNQVPIIGTFGKVKSDQTKKHPMIRMNNFNLHHRLHWSLRLLTIRCLHLGNIL